MDLGRKSPSAGLQESASPEKPKISYPGFNLNDEVAKAYCKEYPCELEDEITATVKLRVTGLRKDEYGHSVNFDVLSMDVKDDGAKEKPEGGEAPKMDEPTEEDSAEEKMLGYKRPKSKKPEPKVTATDLEEP